MERREGAIEERYVEAAGVRARYLTAGTGHPLVLIHGLGMAAVSWRANIEPLSQGHRVIAVDLPGHGYSGMPVGRYGLGYGVGFLEAFLNALGVAQAHLAGESMGGLLTLAFALERPQRVGRLVLVDSAGLGREVAFFLRALSVPPVGEIFVDPSQRGTWVLLRLLMHRSNWRLITEDLVRDISAFRARPGNKGCLLAALRAGVTLWGQRPGIILFERLPRLQAPLLTVWGAQDGVVPVRHAYRAREMVPGSRLHVYDQCGHWPQMEKAEHFNALVRDFLEGAPADGGRTPEQRRP